MTKSELIESIAMKYPHLYLTDVERLVSTILGTIKKSLSQSERVELRSFGVFALKEKAPRNARNPKTGERLVVPAKAVPTFRVGKVLKNRINKDMK